jgi:inorganic pyrophosphatase
MKTADRTTKKPKRGIDSLRPYANKRSKTINVVIETPKGKRNKFVFDQRTSVFQLRRVLPAGSAFPYDFGFVPGTEAEDGDPLDVLVLMDESAYPGCLVEARLIGVLEAEQLEDGNRTRNDRLIAVAVESHDHNNIQSLTDLSRDLLRELEHFFATYNELTGKQFNLLATRGPKRAQETLQRHIV